MCAHRHTHGLLDPACFRVTLGSPCRTLERPGKQGITPMSDGGTDGVVETVEERAEAKERRSENFPTNAFDACAHPTQLI